MHIFHKWSKWVETEGVSTHMFTGITRDIVVLVRECEVCGDEQIKKPRRLP